ncbi:uncharacterized protein LOC142326722 isoform X2 [Lycorma delicatula]|uniref:uncharacterized protein LOC142326722 isoform X2 n=1 Tax=Lycorma delicatula TaxID=130591 RepID=UPI003F50F63A
MATARTFSLVEQKKLQWAKEREEMIGLYGLWGQIASQKSYLDGRRSSIRSQYLSSLDLNNQGESSPAPSEYSSGDRSKCSVRRSPSLPPIYSPEKQSCFEDDRDAEIGRAEVEPEVEGEEGGTSGYASDSGGGNDYHHQQQATHAWVGQRGGHSWQTASYRRSPDSVTSADMGRPRWGDKGVGVGHLWVPTPHNPDARLPQVSDRPGGTPPAWLHRGLNKLGEPAQILVISHPDETRSKDFRGSCDSINSSECTKTYLRGQNVPLEPEELAERERRRQKAVEHQNAIRQQLEERERKRKEEKERRIQEERREEERLRKQQELERIRLEEEKKKQKEKEEKEERKAIAMREALENAERLAREEKIRERRRHIMERANELNDSLRRVHIEEKTEERVSERKPKFQVREEKSVPVPIRNDNSSSLSTESDDGISSSINIVLQPQEIPPNQLSVIVSPGRLLTPSKFRQRHRGIEKSTQTDLQNKIEQRSCKATQRSRIQQPVRLEDRPKWGVNRPDTQYIKQSDRDPYRLKRFVNTKIRNHPTNQETSRSPSPAKHSCSSSVSSNNQSSEGSSNKNQNKSTGNSVNRGTSTPRIMQMILQSGGSVRKSSAGRPRYLSIKGGLGGVINSNTIRQRITNRVQQQNTLVKPTENVVREKTEIVSVRDVLEQLTSLRKGLSIKQHEWDISRSQTPFSEISSRS